MTTSPDYIASCREQNTARMCVDELSDRLVFEFDVPISATTREGRERTLKSRDKSGRLRQYLVRARAELEVLTSEDIQLVARAPERFGAFVTPHAILDGTPMAMVSVSDADHYAGGARETVALDRERLLAFLSSGDIGGNPFVNSGGQISSDIPRLEDCDVREVENNAINVTLEAIRNRAASMRLIDGNLWAPKSLPVYLRTGHRLELATNDPERVAFTVLPVETDWFERVQLGVENPIDVLLPEAYDLPAHLNRVCAEAFVDLEENAFNRARDLPDDALRMLPEIRRLGSDLRAEDPTEAAFDEALSIMESYPEDLRGWSVRDFMLRADCAGLQRALDVLNPGPRP